MVQEAIDDTVKVNAIARELGYSKFHVTRHFKWIAAMEIVAAIGTAADIKRLKREVCNA